MSGTEYRTKINYDTEQEINRETVVNLIKI